MALGFRLRKQLIFFYPETHTDYGKKFDQTDIPSTNSLQAFCHQNQLIRLLAEGQRDFQLTIFDLNQNAKSKVKNAFKSIKVEWAFMTKMDKCVCFLPTYKIG